MSRDGFSVDVAEGVASALRLLHERHYPIIVTDLSMADGHGTELIRRAQQLAPRTLFVVLTGVPSPQLPDEAEFRTQLVSVIAKPWDHDALLETMHRCERMLGMRASQRPAALDEPAAERLLLLEDDDADAELVSAYLDCHLPNCQVTREARLSGALQRLQACTYDLIVSDLTLPDARGLDAVLRLQAASSDTALVVLSGLDDANVAMEAVRYGAQDFLYKGGIDGPTLVRSLRHAKERKQTEFKLSQLANFDAVTGLANRVQMSERLSNALSRARNGEGPCAVLYLDLDGFKAINDRLGHAAGDSVLSSVAGRLQQAVGPDDLVARLGGDEFGILLNSCESTDVAVGLADAILDRIARPYEVDFELVEITVSIGIAIPPGDGDTVESVMKAADHAMYRAKRRGRNTFELYRRPSSTAGPWASRLARDLRQALDQDRYTLLYQTQFAPNTQTSTCAEALIRWLRSPGELVAPDQFLGVLESSSGIVAVGQWVIRTACRDLANWRRQGLPIERVAVNISARQLEEGDLVASVRTALRDADLRPEHLELELTESAVMKSPEVARTVLNKLKHIGVRLAMDDFGTGHSSLSHLYRLPFDTVKIDRSFVQDVLENDRCQAVTRAIIALAKQLHLTIVAEGVENTQQSRFLARAGCDLLQGYLLSRPTAAENITGHSLVPPALRPPRLIEGAAKTEVGSSR